MQTSKTSHLFSLGCHRPAVSFCRYTVRGYTHTHVNIVVNRIAISEKKDREWHVLPKRLPIMKCPSTPPSPLINSHKWPVNRRSGCKVQAGSETDPSSIRPSRPIDHHASIQAMHNRRVRMAFGGSRKRGPRLHKYSTDRSIPGVPRDTIIKVM
jgi:hypothetical protein